MGVREEHIELVQRAFSLIEHGEYEQIRPFLTDDVVWTGAITGPPIHGRDEMIAYMQQFQSQLGMTMQIEAADFFADEHQVVAHEHVRVSRGDRTIETESAHVFEFRNSKVSKVTVFTGDPEGFAALME